MLPKASVFLRRSLRVFTRLFSLRLRIAFSVLLVISSLWLVSKFVLAEKEASVYVFPSAVSSEGWEGDTQALGQDLSPDAELADFNRDNSASVFFGSPSVETASTTGTTTEEMTLPLESIQNIPNIETTPAASSSVSPPIDVPLEIPNPFVPTVVPQSIDTPMSSDTSPTAPASSDQSFNVKLFKSFSKIFGLRTVFADDIASTTRETTGQDTSDATTSLEASSSSTVMSASTSSDADTVTPMSSDPYTVVSCKTLGKPCHLMEFDGFGLGGALAEKTLLSASLDLSLASHGSFSSQTHDRVMVRAYHAGRWEFLGEEEVKGDISNGKRGGYLSFPLSSFAHWSDLSDLKVVVEYVREGDEEGDAASAYVDGIWVNAKYAEDTLSDASSPESLALSAANVRSALFAKDAEARKSRRDTLTLPDEQIVSFVHGDEHKDAKLTVKTDRDTYHVLGNAQTYFNVTNESADPQVLRLQFHFPSEGGKVVQVSRFTRNVPYKVGTLKHDAVGYFCAGGWMNATGTDAAGRGVCGDTQELRSCDTYNDDRTNCIQNSARVGLDENTEYRSGWSKVAVKDGSFRDESGIFAKAIDLILGELPKDVIPSSLIPIAHVEDSILLEPGATAYFRADIETPLNGRGDFYVEAAAESGAYGLVHAAWDGSWNYRTPVDVSNDKLEASGSFVVPIALAHLPESFWTHVNSDASDVRFVDGTGETELPYWIASWKPDAHDGLAWVRIPKGNNGTTTRIFAYVGDKDAESRSDQFAPFRTETPTVRAIVFGGSQHDMTLHVIALAEDVRVVMAGRDDAVTLRAGESALFKDIAPSMEVLADGPVSLSVEAPGGAASVVPMGYSGMKFVIPGIGGTRQLALAAVEGEDTHASISSRGDTQSIDPISGSITESPVDLADSARLDADFDVLVRLASSETSLAAPVYPATDEDVYGLAFGKTSAGFGVDGSGMTATCSSGGHKEVDGRREGMTTVIDPCIEGSIVNADAVRISKLNKPVSALVENAGDLSAFIPKSEFASSYIIPEETSHIALICAPSDGTITVGLFDPERMLIASTTCEGRGTRPGKAFLSGEQTAFALGSELRVLGSATGTFMALIESDKKAFADTAHPVTLLAGAPLLRSESPNHPDISFGAEEFVVPGEHRKLDVDADGNEKKHVNKFLSKAREFSVRERPGFTFQYTPQSNGLMQDIRNAFDIAPFTISKVKLLQGSLGELPIAYDVAYGANNEWILSLKEDHERIRPGKYTIHVEIEEGGETYIDEFDFYWGVLAINYNRSIFTPGETASISMGALSNNGNTLCDARLKLWVVDPVKNEMEVPVTASGLCKGNNVVDVPDYSATYVIPRTDTATGTYQVKLVRLDESDNVASQVTDSFEVRATVPYEIERVGPTRIYPVAHYPMKIRVHANEAFEGDIAEKVPGDFVFIDRGNADLQWGDPDHTFITATWPVKLVAGQTLDLEYTFDAPDRSPYLYLLGPLQMKPKDGEVFAETREWQIASDAAGIMMIFYDDSTYPIPANWTCVSCKPSDVFYQRFAVGSSSYSSSGGGIGGTATHTPTASATVYGTSTGAVGPGTNNNTSNANIAHTHTLTPVISGVSNLPSYRSLRVLQYNSAGEPSSLPTSTIVAFDIASSSLPSGWNRYALEDGYYPYSASTSAVTGGANTHFHIATGTTSVPPEAGLRSNGGVSSAAASNHTHSLSTTTTDTINNEPPYVEVLFARLSAPTTTLSNYMITMWTDTPPAGWMSLSGEGGALNGKFLKASTTYGGTGGSSSHTHADILNATTTTASSGNVYTAGATSQAPTNHYHTVDVTGFSTDSTIPPYLDVIFAKRLSGIVLWTQDSYWLYANANALDPTDPWPAGGSDLAENTPIDSSDISMKPADKIRLRMNFDIANSTSTVSSQQFKMQYVAGTDCVNALNWTDVAAISSSTALWRGYDNGAAANNGDITTLLLSSSTVKESYVEQNNSTGTATQIPYQPTPGVGEWDWVLQDNLAAANTTYCFRVVKSDGTPLDTYMNYPSILTNSQPNTTTPLIPFNNEKASTTLPNFTFTATDPEADDLDYEIQIDTSTGFGAPTVDKDSSVNPELFDNLTTPSNKAPFTQGETIHFKSSTALTNGTTYWWRVRAKDSNNSNTWGAWSSARSMTIDTTVVVSTWHQTTSSQFQTDNFNGTNSSTSDSIMLTVGSSTGTTTGSGIDFSVGTLGNAWGNFKVASTTPPGFLRVSLEYFTSTSSWALIPDAVLPGNSTGFTATTTSLLGVDPTIYTTIRPRADFTNSGGTPKLLDWTIEWGYSVVPPTLYLPFNNQKVATRTPAFEFMTTDPQSDNLTYQISWSTSTSFTSSSTVDSATTSAGWVDVTNSLGTNPFTSGHRIRYTVQTPYIFASSTPYYWKVRARDPSGANTYSLWSAVRSLTVDTTVVAATWFQTSDGQFSTDAFTSVYNLSTTSVAVSTSTDEVMMAYGEGAIQTPRYRIWDGTTLGSELSALSVGAQIDWTVLRASPLIGQYILGTQGADRDVNYQVYQNGAWGNLMELLTTAPSLQRRSFDVAYESLSGRALAVSCDGSTDAKYQIWDGSAWAATGTINLTFASNCEWVRMASNPINNEIIAVFRNAGTSYEAQVWNATTSTWGNSITMGSMTEIAHEGMAVEYEASSSKAMVVVSNGNNNNLLWRQWRSTSTTWSAAATTQALGDDFENGNIHRNVYNNDLAVCYIDEDEDVGVLRWNGNTSAWIAFSERTVTGNSKNGRPVDCQYKKNSAAVNHILIPYSDTLGTRYSSWNTASYDVQQSINAIPQTWTDQLVRTSASGTMLGLFFDHNALSYLFAVTTGTSSWSSTQTVENTASVTTSPYGEPFYMAPKNPATQGTIISSTINFSDGLAPAWDQALWSATLSGASTFKVQVQYYSTASSSWTLIPDTDLAGNSSGTSTSPINLRSLDINTYAQIRLVGNFTCVLGNCPTLNDWTVKWAQGLNISGSVKQHDLATLVTSGTVAVAVNGVLQSGKTGTIGASGLWSISNVTVFSGDTIEVWVSGGASSSRAVSLAKSDGSGDIGGIPLYQRWVTIGSASTTNQSLSLYDLSRYDNSVSGADSGDIFFDVDDSTGDYNHCAPSSGVCYDSSLLVLAGNTFRPSTSTPRTVNMYDLRLEGSLYAGANTIKVGASWRNLGGFTSESGTVIFNATTSTRTIDNTSSATSTFYNVTFGEAATTATWSFTTALTATGTVAMNYGTTSPGTQALTLQGNLSIGASGTFTKGTATTTFSGSAAKTWTDSSAAKQDMGNVLIDGTSKTVTLASGVKAYNLTIGADDTLDAGGANTLTVLGYWENNHTFTAQTGTVTFTATTTAQTINQGSSSFYNLTFNGVGGAWRWLNTNATTSNDLTIATGTVTLPGGTLAVGGSFDNSGGTFTNNSGVLKMTSTASGKNIRASGSSFNDLTFNGSGGGWTFLDTNATTSHDLTITAGTPIFPTGVLVVGNNFDTSGAFTANGGTLKMTSSALGETIRTSGSSLGALYIGGSGTFSILDANATATGTVTFAAGTTTFPTGTFTIGGSFTNSAVFTANGGTVLFNGSSGTKTITTATSSFANATVNGNASFTIAGNATTTSNFTLTNANLFTMNSGLTLAVGGTFATVMGGASTTWTGSTLALNSATSYTLNTKTLGGDAYGTLRLAANTNIRAWSSSATTYVIDPAASLYSQNHGGVTGEVDIFGAYARSSGTDYWSANTDFDGTALATSSQRTALVRFDSGATALFSNSSTIQILGTSTATTTIDRRSAGNYGLTVSSSTINAQYYQFSNMNATGLYLAGSTTVTSLANGDFSLDVIGGSSMTVSSTTINTNPALQIFTVKFATSTGISSGFNVTATGTAASFSSYWRFKEHYGNYAGETHDNDPSGNPGEVRWDDSSFVISISGTVYSDAGATIIGSPTCDGVALNVRVKVDGAGNFAASCSATSSYYHVDGVTFSGDTVMTVYLDTGGLASGAIVTRTAAADLSGFNIYQHRVILRHEDVSVMTIAKMDAYDSGQDPDVPFLVTLGSPNTLAVNPDTELWIWNSKTFAPGGNITLNSGGSGGTYDGTFHIDNNAVFTAAGSETHSVGGKWVADSGATFTAASSTFIFTATTTGKSITGVAALTFWRMNFNGAGGNWSVNQNITLGDTLLMSTGTLSGTSNVTVNGTSTLGSGAIAMTGGTFTFSNGGTFGGMPDWSFFNLTFGSSSTATTAKTASSTVTTTGVLTVAANNILQAGTSTTWLLTGAGTPLVFTGTFTSQNSVVRYAATTSTNVTPAAYYQLDFGATGTNTPTYTLNAGTFTTAGALNIGMGSSTIYVNVNANDPTFTASGDVNIRASSTLTLSDTGTFTARRNWLNQGTTTPSGGTLTFDATTTGFTVNTGSSSLAKMVFNDTAGGWTIIGSATTTSDFTLTAGTFTMASGTTLEVGGVFTNSIGGASTTWNGSTLYLNSAGSETINTKSAGLDQYNTLQVGANTKVRMWGSNATTTTVNSTGSLYSQNHNAVSGSLYIWGSYARSSGTDYWSYANDFDGTALGSKRQANVRMFPGTTLTFSGGGLEVLGTSTASTTLDVQSAGTYAWSLSGGSTTMQYYSVRNTDANGLNISGTPVINELSDGDFELGIAGGTLIKVAGATIDANPLRTFFRQRFATTTAITGNNITATGVSASAWRFNLHYGNLSGEAFDSDPGGDPGYLIWDDSAAQLTISGNVYSDEGNTPIGSPVCNGVAQNVILKVQGAGSYTSACNAGTGAYSISNVLYNPGDTITVFLAGASGAKAANVAYDPATNINNMHLYQNRVIVRHEQGNAVTNTAMDQYDFDQDTNIPFRVSGGNLTVNSGTALIVWTSKTFAPGGNVTVYANASSTIFDGTVHLYATSTWSSSGSPSYTIGGHFLAESGASISPANSTFTFTATTSGKTIAASTTLTFYNLTFNGVAGAWNVSGLATTTNDLTIATGTVTLPSGTLAVGGSFNNSGGTFVNNSGTVKFTATAAGKTIRVSTSTFSNLSFEGSGGGWTFSDMHATTTGSVTLTAGTLNFPTGVFAVGNNFDNQSGAFNAVSSSTLKLTSTGLNRTLRFSGSYPGGLWVSASGTYAIFDSNATTTGNVLLTSGTTTFPYASLYVGGSFTNSAGFIAGTSTVTFFATSSGKTITAGSSSFASVNISGAAGGFTVTGNATTTSNFTLTSLGTFTQTPGTTLDVGGTFTNLVGGAPTTWSGSTIALNSGTSYTLNTKTLGGDVYDTLRLAANTNIRMWGSSVGTSSIPSTASLYSQNNAAVSGSLYIYGNYARTTGTDYWSYATDFDGVALGGSSRQANVRFAANATATFSTMATLQMLGTAAASTTVDRQSAGNYAMTLDSSYWNAQYYQFRNMNTTGLNLTGTTTITNMNNGDFQLDVNGGSMMTVASTSVDQNASASFFTIRFATSSVNAGYNIIRSGTTTNSITFGSEYGNYAGEAFDLDGIDGCGSFRWTDSSCLISDQRDYRWRNDDGAEGALATEWYNQSWSRRQRVRITTTATSTLSNVQVKIAVPYDTDMQSNFNDLRFTDSSGTTSIPFFTESYTSATATVWVKVPSLPASSFADVFMYYGNGSAANGGVGTSTFTFFDDFEDNNITEYTGNTTLFSTLGSPLNYERLYGVGASAGNELTGKTTDGIGQASAGVGRDTTFRFFQYVNTTPGAGSSDEPCFLFAIQAPITGHQNYAVCLSPFGADHLVIAKNAVNNGRDDGSTQLVSKSVTYTTGWYETSIDWQASGNLIAVTVYDSTGAVFATTSASDSSYTSGGVGFSYWGMHGGWDIPSARVYNSAVPTATFFTEQQDSGATWKAAENTVDSNQSPNQNVRLRFTVKNSGAALYNEKFRLQVADKAAAANCESVATGNYTDVTTTSGAGCGASPACMKTSTQYSDQASTTQLLSIPTGFTFAQNQILQDPSNQTASTSINSSQFTEVEYNFQMTAYATQNSYCFRTTNAGTALDSYTKVAEMNVLHPPVISGLSFNNNSNIALTEGTTTTIMATATVSDLNGYTDLVNASSTFYRSSVSGGNMCTADKNSCYQVGTTSCSFSSCAGNICTVSCSAPLYYFADPTDVGSVYAADNWQAYLDVWDTSSSHDHSSSSEELYTLSGLTTTSTIAYGSVTVGFDTGATDATSSVNNTGNSTLNLNLGGDDLYAGSSIIPYNKQKYATSTFTYSACPICNVLTSTSSLSAVALGVAKATTTVWSPYKDIYWGISIPLGTAPTTFSGFNVFQATL